jgi:hypothetical protein
MEEERQGGEWERLEEEERRRARDQLLSTLTDPWTSACTRV